MNDFYICSEAYASGMFVIVIQ